MFAECASPTREFGSVHRHVRKDRDGEDCPRRATEARQNASDAHSFQRRWLAPGVPWGGHEGESVQMHDGAVIIQHGCAN